MRSHILPPHGPSLTDLKSSELRWEMSWPGFDVWLVDPRSPPWAHSGLQTCPGPPLVEQSPLTLAVNLFFFPNRPIALGNRCQTPLAHFFPQPPFLDLFLLEIVLFSCPLNVSFPLSMWTACSVPPPPGCPVPPFFSGLPQYVTLTWLFVLQRSPDY